MFDVSDILRLSAIPKIGPQKIRALVTHFGDPAKALSAPPRELIKVQGIDKKLASAIAHARGTEQFVKDQLRRLNILQARIMTLWDDEFPPLLKKIYDPPVLLYVLGSFKENDRYSIAVVGTRKPSAYGRMAAESFSKALTSLGMTVVSGLARGIDTIAHAAAVENRGRTVAVLGSGLDVPYPQENSALMARIERQGAVVSEFPLGTSPDPTNFPRRNRIVSGLSLGTIVVESDIDGGAMITASTALDQNREVFAVPGLIGEKRSKGPNALIREGRAKLVESEDDVLAELEYHVRPLLGSRRSTVPPVELTLFERTVLDVLQLEPTHIDTIAELASTSAADALVTLLSLEFKGAVKQFPGKMFVRL